MHSRRSGADHADYRTPPDETPSPMFYDIRWDQIYPVHVHRLNAPFLSQSFELDFSTDPRGFLVPGHYCYYYYYYWYFKLKLK